MPAECEINDCGVLAVGRCATCGKAMCTSHRALNKGVPVIDQCSSCQSAMGHAYNTRQQGHRDRAQAAQANVKKLAAALASAGVPDEVYWEGRRTTRITHRTVHDPSQDKRGWSIGEYEWFIRNPKGGGKTEKRTTYVTASGGFAAGGYGLKEGPDGLKSIGSIGAEAFAAKNAQFWEGVEVKLGRLVNQYGVRVS